MKGKDRSAPPGRSPHQSRLTRPLFGVIIQSLRPPPVFYPRRVVRLTVALGREIQSPTYPPNSPMFRRRFFRSSSTFLATSILSLMPHTPVRAEEGSFMKKLRESMLSLAADPAVGQITRLCGYLPLAIGMLARQLRHHPARSGAELAAGLAAARDRLAVMRAENLSVAAAFDLSYQDLTAEQQRLFRRLGLVSAPDVDAYAAAALDDISLDPPAPGWTSSTITTWSPS